ncbi:MAG: hypothetical protein KJO44_04745, partial [Gemmatimonadetes bacterium]|nr:hypothetical protein [Gemmatimonadota bacterium]
MLRNVILLTVVTALSCAASGRAEGPAEIEARTPLSLEDFAILEYVAAGAYAPGALIALDNYDRILFACMDGCSVVTLRSSGICFSESQL